MDPARPGDRARVTARVGVPPADAFRIFTEEIDQWWRRGRRFRHAGARRGFIALEPGVGGRLYESFESKTGERVLETGRVTVWEPPERLSFEWRNANFRPDEKTLVEVTFAASSRGTLVTVTHSGWADVPADHPARHGMKVAGFIASTGRWWGDLMTALNRHATR